ncbi:MAG: enoyl-CoA hydratase-related protein [Thiomonas sp.]
MSQTHASHLSIDQQGAVLTLTLNRPESLNSLTAVLVADLLRALDDAAAQPDVRCVVFTGAGRAFCAGQDLKDPAVVSDGPTPKDLGAVVGSNYKPLVLRLRSMPVPTLAAVNGVAAGAGASLALTCDMVVARRSAAFIQAFSAIGLIPDSGATWLLPRLVGRARALGLAMLGDKLSAEEAQRIGLIWACVDDDAFDAQVGVLAQRLASLPTKVLVRTRQLLDQGLTSPLEQALDAEAAAQRELGFAADYVEGLAAFAQKRAPRFTDR